MKNRKVVEMNRYRSPCPSPERLVAYFEQRNEPERDPEIERHLGDCDACMTELIRITRSLIDVDEGE